MDKQKTALTDYLQWIDSIEYQFQSITGKEMHKMFKEKAISLLPKEREDIEGFVRKYQRADVIVGLSKLFNQTFTQYKTKEHE